MVANRVTLTAALGLIFVCVSSSRSFAQQEVSNGAPFEEEVGFKFDPGEWHKVSRVNIPAGKRLVIRMITGEMTTEAPQTFRLVSLRP